VDIVVKGRHTEVPERFRQHVIDKLSKLEKLDGKVISLDVEVSKERNPRLAARSDRIEITCRSKGPVIRAEAAADDPYAALDIASGKLESRLRRAADRRRVHHGTRTPVSVAAATAVLRNNGTTTVPSTRPSTEPGTGSGKTASEVSVRPEEPPVAGERLAPLEVDGEGPLIVREKTHKAKPMTLDQALYEMELVGHDFYLFVDADSAAPSVVYRRRGYDYGVIRLEV
jgi:ribosomal subunit interface protein